MASPLDLAEERLSDLLGDEPSYRIAQVRAGLLAGRRPRDMTDLPGRLRERLQEALPAGLALARESESDGGRTVKWLWELSDGTAVETVLMHYPRRTTVCVSTQAGCAMACSFCATGQAGFSRHLTAGEILEQVVRARRAAEVRRPLSNVVFMGMGEPMANYDAVWAAVEVLHGEIGLSARQLTISTVGLVPGIRRLSAEAIPVNLAVSLHAANDELRDELVPVNRRWPLSALMEACDQYVRATRRRLSFEWALIDGVNDRRSDVGELAALARPLGAHVNLIPLNPTPGYAVRGTTASAAAAFRNRLRDAGVNATLRRNRGTDIDAACGQLAGATTITALPTPLLPQ